MRLLGGIVDLAFYFWISLYMVVEYFYMFSKPLDGPRKPICRVSLGGRFAPPTPFGASGARHAGARMCCAEYWQSLCSAQDSRTHARAQTSDIKSSISISHSSFGHSHLVGRWTCVEMFSPTVQYAVVWTQGPTSSSTLSHGMSL